MEELTINGEAEFLTSRATDSPARLDAFIVDVDAEEDGVFDRFTRLLRAVTRTNLPSEIVGKNSILTDHFVDAVFGPPVYECLQWVDAHTLSLEERMGLHWTTVSFCKYPSADYFDMDYAGHNVTLERVGGRQFCTEVELLAFPKGFHMVEESSREWFDHPFVVARENLVDHIVPKLLFAEAMEVGTCLSSSEFEGTKVSQRVQMLGDGAMVTLGGLESSAIYFLLEPLELNQDTGHGGFYYATCELRIALALPTDEECLFFKASDN